MKRKLGARVQGEAGIAELAAAQQAEAAATREFEEYKTGEPGRRAQDQQQWLGMLRAVKQAAVRDAAVAAAGLVREAKGRTTQRARE